MRLQTKSRGIFMKLVAAPHIFPSSECQASSQGEIIWLYGLSGAGKSTIASRTRDILKRYNKNVFILDGDDLRTGLNSDLGFTEEDREENIRRAAETALLLSRTCDIVICTFITPKNTSRELIESILKSHPFHSVCINTPLSECEKRDTKGLYKKARSGEIGHFTGISSPYDFPKTSSNSINTLNNCVDDCAYQLIQLCNIKI